MAQPPSTRGPLDSERTKQQLRELDDLLQRMLAAPLNAQAETGEAPAVGASSVSASAAVAEDEACPPQADETILRAPSVPASRRMPIRRELQEAHAIQAAEPPVKKTVPITAGKPRFMSATSKAKSAAPLSAQDEIPFVPPAPTTVEERAPAPSPEGKEPAIEERHKPPAACQVEAPAKTPYSHGAQIAPAPAIEKPVEEKAPVLHRALVAINDTYDRIFNRLGPLGRFLTTPLGRDVLAWIGTALLALAAAMWLTA